MSTDNAILRFDALSLRARNARLLCLFLYLAFRFLDPGYFEDPSMTVGLLD